MNVYDFDNTIYDGETVIDFFKFYLKMRPSLIRFVPLMAYMLLRYKLGKISLFELEQKILKYTKKIVICPEEIENYVIAFWDINEKKIKTFYKEQQKPDDVIISASFGFILKEIMKRLNITNYLCSDIDFKTGEITQLCFRDNKPDIFKATYPDAKIDNFYTDSINDLPMIKLSEKAYMVKGVRITQIEKRA